MLMAFSVANYKVFKDEVTFSMVATADKKLEDNISVCCGKHKVLKTASVYGANASGKTTIFQALLLFRNFVLQSHSFAENVMLTHVPFALDQRMKKEPTVFRVEFIRNEVRYSYGFAYNTNAILEESLYYYPSGRRTKVFERKGQDFVFGRDKRFRGGNARRVRPKSLFLSVSAQFNDEVCMSVFNWFTSDLLVMCGYDQLFSIDVLVNTMNKDKEFAELMKRAFRIADFGITDVVNQSKKNEKQIGLEPVFLAPTTIQDFVVEHEINGKKTTLPLGWESSGTIRFLSVIGPVVSTLKSGGTLVIDEIDMSFHTDVCQWIMGLFLDPAENRKGAQLIFNTHEVGLLDQTVVRRDQVWFTMKDWETGKGDLRRLSDYKVRNDLDIRKAYLNGSFGAKPFIAPERLME